MAKVEFLYNGRNIDVYCNENDKFEKIIQKFSIKIQQNTADLCFLYGGQLIDKNLTFIGLVNSFDRQRKVISVIVTDNYYKGDNSMYLKENKELKEKLIEANKTIEKQNKEIQDLKYQISMIKSEGMTQINSLMEIIDKKDKQINQLKDKTNHKNPSNINLNDIKTIQFKSSDMKVDFAISCLGTQSFSEIEEKLYKEYPEYRETNNQFLHMGTVIKRFKTINENKIKNGDIIMMIVME